MRWQYILVLLLAWTVSCRESATKPPGVLSHEEMVKVLAEIYITEQKVTNLSLYPDSTAKLFRLLQPKIFESTGIPDTVFRKSFDFYMQRPQEMQEIYSVLVDTLQLREQRADFRPDLR